MALLQWIRGRGEAKGSERVVSSGRNRALPCLAMIGAVWWLTVLAAAAQPYPPINVQVFGELTRNRLVWTHNSLNSGIPLQRYRIYRGTTYGSEIQIASVAATVTTFNDTTAVFGQPYIYYLRTETTSGVLSGLSQRVHRLVPRVGRTIYSLPRLTVRNYHLFNWDFPLTQWTKTAVAIGTIPGNYNDVVRWTYFRDLANAVESSFTNNLAYNTTYYVNVAYGRPDWNGTPNNDFWTSYSSSLPFRIVPETFSDVSSSSFFLAGLRTTMVDVLPTGGLASRLFSGSGGGFWRMRRLMQLQERNQAGRINAPARAIVSGIPAGQLAAGRAASEVRVADDRGRELPCFIASETTAGGWTTQFIVHFLTSANQNSTTDYTVYWGNPAAVNPGYSWQNSCQRTSQWDVSPWYSRRVYRTNPMLFTPGSTRLIASPPSPVDDAGVWYNLPSAWGNWPFFDRIATRTWVCTNGYMSLADDVVPTNTWSAFAGPSTLFQGLIAPLWLNLMVNDTFPTTRTSGLYRNTSGDWLIFTWIANRFNAANEGYIFQAWLYRYGDIRFQYESMNYRGLWDVPSSSNDNPVNVAPHHTVGLSNGDGVNWLQITDGARSPEMSPLHEIGDMNVNHLFQSAFSWNQLTTATDPTMICAMSGLTSVAHYDSRIFDSGSTSPTWGNVTYDIAGNGGSIDLYVRTSTSPTSGWPAWSLSHRIATDAATPGGVALSLPKQQYLQYRAVFKRQTAADDPRLNSIQFTVGYITLASVTCAVTNVSQGQTFPATMTVINNYSVPVDITIASPTTSPSTASITFSLISPLPTGVLPGQMATISVMITLATDSAINVGTTLNGFVQATDGLVTLSDSGADQTSSFTTRQRSILTIHRVRSTFTKVNKGQGGIIVNADMQNTGYATLLFQGASLTFTLGSYQFSLLSPTSGSTYSNNVSFTGTFTVLVQPDSPSGLAYLGATASGTNAWVPGQRADATAATLLHSWIVQEPAQLGIVKVEVPPLIYRGQANVPVGVEVMNLGEADAWLASCALSFSAGSYTTVFSPESFPIKIEGGFSRVVQLLVNIDELSPVGPVVIDAAVQGTDGNTGLPLTASGALDPGHWTILAEKLEIFRDPGFLYAATSFTRPSIGTTSVFVAAENLAPLREYRIKCFDPADQLLPNGTKSGLADLAGRLGAQFDIDPSSSYGRHRVVLYNALETAILAETSFLVVTEASLTASLQAPSTVSVGQSFPVRMGVHNTGGAEAVGVGATPLQASGTGNATLLSGPAPLSLDLPGDVLGTFSWTYQALSPGWFQLTGAAVGQDGNSGAFIAAATVTSNLCLIQTPASVTILALTATPTLVYRNQRNIPVALCLYNSGQAAASIANASLTFSVGFGSFRLASPPALPWVLAGGETATITFQVDINSTAPIGWATMTGRVDFRDVNNPSATIRTGGTDSWFIATASIICARDAAFTGSQYFFNQGQTVYVKASGLPLHTKVNVKYFPHLDPPSGGGVGPLPPLNTFDTGIVTHDYTIPPSTPHLNTWRILVDDDLDGDPNTLGNILAEQFIDVYKPAVWRATLSVASPTCFIGDQVLVSILVENIATGPTRASAQSNQSGFSYAPGSVGSYTLIGPSTIGYQLIPSMASYSFNRMFQAATDSGLLGSTSLRLWGNAIQVREEATQGTAYLTNLQASPTVIYRKVIDLASSVLDFGVVPPGSTSVLLESRLRSLGNHALPNVRFQRVDLRKTATETMPGSSLLLDPEPPFSLGTTTNQLQRAQFVVPVNQPAGVYVATMAFYEDHNRSSTFETADPNDLVMVRVTVASACLLSMQPTTIDFGLLSPGNTTASRTLTIQGIGNLAASAVQFIPLPEANFQPLVIGPLSPAASAYASLSLSIASSVLPGVYKATATVFADQNGDGSFTVGEPEATCLLTWSVGTPSFVLAPDRLSMGLGGPSTLLSLASTTILNDGEVLLSAFLTMATPFWRLDGAAVIGSDCVALDVPGPLMPADSATATTRVYIPAGTATGTYLGTFTWFFDQNQNRLPDPGEVWRSQMASFAVDGFHRLVPTLQTFWIGSAQPGAMAVQSIGLFNAGSLPLPFIRFVVSDMKYGAAVLPSTAIMIIPEPVVDVAAGQLVQPLVNIAVPSTQPFGAYQGSVKAFGDLNDNLMLDLGEPVCSFTLQLEVGIQDLAITAPAAVTLTGKPAEMSNGSNITVKNTGTLTLARVKVGISDLASGPLFIASSSGVVSPNPLLGIMLIGQSKTVSLAIQIPMGQTPATYTGTIYAWEDVDNDGLIDAGEAVASIPLQLAVTGSKQLAVSPTTLDFGVMTRQDVATLSFLAQNVGNLALIDGRWALNPLLAGANSIGVGAMTIAPSPIGPMAAPPPGLPNNAPATLSLMIPPLTPDGLYLGPQIFYEDEFNPALNTYDPGLEPAASFTVRVVVTTPLLSANPLLVDWGGYDPPAWTATRSITLSNTGGIDLRTIRSALTLPLTNGLETIPATCVVVVPSVLPSLPIGGIASCQAQALLPSAALPPGTYTGTLLFWEDRNGNGTADLEEAYQSVSLQVVVNAVYRLVLASSSLVVFRGSTSPWQSFTAGNLGNVPLTGFTWLKQALTTDTFTIPVGSFTLEWVGPDPLPPQATGTARWQVGPISATQEMGGYRGEQQLIAGLAVATNTFACEVKEGSFGLGSATVRQFIATSTFPAGQPKRRFILSAYACPGSGTSGIGFVAVRQDGTQTASAAVQVTANGVVSWDGTPGVAVAGGVAEVFSTASDGDGPSTWYRIYVAFDYAFDETLASTTLIYLQNQSPTAVASSAVWFDGVQLEAAARSDQERPTVFNQRGKIISPNQNWDVQGVKRYSEH